jgi:aspartate 1-decarboxylase
MLIKLLKSKLHKLTITEADLDYEGSIEIDSDLLEAANIVPYKAVWVWNCNEGSRLMTYALPAPSGSKRVCLNGAAARLGMKGDKIIVSTFADFSVEESKTFQPAIVLVENNEIKSIPFSL